MVLYKTTITPLSNFASKLKGDTLFGQICWAIRFKYGEHRLKELLSNYDDAPFLIVSDPFAKGYLPKPTMPSIFLNENSEDKKINRKKIHVTMQNLVDGEFHKAKTDDEVQNQDHTTVVVRNAINYKTLTTGDKGFDPYGEKEIKLSQKDIYFLFSDNFTLDELLESLSLVGQVGYGKDSSIGKGRFEFSKFVKVDINSSSKTYMALSPFVPLGTECEDLFYEPFTRFGKTGASRANTNPFKKPIIMANSGAVINFKEKKSLSYIGKSIQNISTYKDVVHQGYSIVVPIKEL